MVSTTNRPSPRQRAITWLAIAFILLVGILIDASIPARFLMTPLYAVAVLIAAWRQTERGVVISAALALATNTYSALTTHTPPILFLLYTVALILICVLALTVATQRRRISDLLAEQVRLHTQSEDQRAKLQTILENAPSGIIFVDAHSGAIVANPALEGLIGHAARPGAGREQYQDALRYPDGRPLPQAELPSSIALQTHQTVREELLVLRPNGQETPVVVIAAPVWGSHGQISGAIAVFQDITAYKQFERARQEWTSIIAHDLRQPATVIKGYAELIKRKAIGSDPSLVRPAEHIHEAAANLDRMIFDLLEVTRIETRRLVLKKEGVDLSTLVHAIVEREAAVTCDHPVSVTVSEGLPPIEVDPLRVEQVIDNLLSNAVKYGYPNTPIQVVLTCHDHNVEVSVTNEGEGIPPSEMPKLFTRFYRTQEARQGTRVGLGLGLYIAKGLVEAHGGHIWAESIPGKRSTFHFTLPVKPEPPEAPDG